VIVTPVPPLASPLAGEMLVTVGVAIYVNLSADVVALVPPGVMTVTSTGPAEPPGEVAVIWVAEFTVKAVAAVPPNITAVAPVNPVPVIMTPVLPLAGPLAGEMLVTVGAEYTMVNAAFFDADCPCTFFTLTSHCPTDVADGSGS
jgi:hypothetical protein